MQEWIDYALSTRWISIALFILSALMVTTIWRIRIFKDKLPNRIAQAVLSLAFLFILFYMILGSSGYAVEFKYAAASGDRAVLIEEHESGDGDGGSFTKYRAYVIDLKDGKRILRTGISYSNLMGINAKGVLMHEGVTVVLRSMDTWKKLQAWDKTQGFEKYRQLESGINYVQTTRLDISETRVEGLKITTQNGHVYYFDPTTETLYDSLPRRPYGYRDGYQYDRYHIMYNYGSPNSVYYSFERTTGEIQKLKKTVSRDNKTDFFTEELLHPEIIHFDNEKQYFVVLHYETLDKSKAVFTALDMNLQKKWQVRQSHLRVTDDFQENTFLGTCIIHENNLLATFGGFIVCIDLSGGEIKWISRQ